MMKKNLFAFVLLLVGCTADEQLENILGSGTSEREPVPVTFSVSEVLDLTRASSSIVTFDANEQIMVQVKPDGESDAEHHADDDGDAEQFAVEDWNFARNRRFELHHLRDGIWLLLKLFKFRIFHHGCGGNARDDEHDFATRNHADADAQRSD